MQYGVQNDKTHLCKSTSSPQSPSNSFIVILVGDANVGKTHILNRYIKGQLPKHNVPTIGVEFATKVVTLSNGANVKAQIWDTAGQERYRAITSAHYRKALGALIVYDITKERTFDSVQRWIEELKLHAEPDIIIVLIGNKSDLVEKNPALRQVSRESAQQLAKEHGMIFEETSAYTSANVNDVFENLLKEILITKGQDKTKDNSVMITPYRPAQNNNADPNCC